MSPPSNGRDAPATEAERPPQAGVPADLEPIRAAIKGIRFGEVRIVIQDGVVIQIDRVEKRRMR
jgi:hypothetical protein